MSAVSPDAQAMSEEHRQDRAQRALRVAVVTGFTETSNHVQESCLGLCNACRESVPLECRISEGVPPTLLAMVLPHVSQAQQTEAPPTRVSQPHRVRRVELTLNGVFISPGSTCVDMSEVQWSEGTKEIRLLRFDRTVDDVRWPANLDRLSFCIFDLENAFETNWSAFNHPLSNVIFPSGLREIFLGEEFNQPIDDVAWPHGLEKISLPGFNQPIDDVRWPPAMKSLKFMPPKQIYLRKNPDTCAEELDFDENGYDCKLTNLPASLETLWLSDTFDQCLGKVIWPPGFVTLELGVRCKWYLNILLPPSLRHVYSMHEVDGAPEGCVVSTGTDYKSSSSDVYEDDDCPFPGFAADSDYEGYDSPIM